MNQFLESVFAEEYPHIWPSCCPEERPPGKYLVYNIRERPELFADDEDEIWGYHFMIHLFMRGNYIGDKKKIKKILKENKCTVTEIETLYEKDSKYHHVVFTGYFEEREE